MPRAVTLVLAVLLLAGCGAAPATPGPSASAPAIASDEPSAEPTVEATPEPTVAATPTPEPAATPLADGPLREGPKGLLVRASDRFGERTSWRTNRPFVVEIYADGTVRRFGSGDSIRGTLRPEALATLATALRSVADLDPTSVPAPAVIRGSLELPDADGELRRADLPQTPFGPSGTATERLAAVWDLALSPAAIPCPSTMLDPVYSYADVEALAPEVLVSYARRLLLASGDLIMEDLDTSGGPYRRLRLPVAVRDELLAQVAALAPLLVTAAAVNLPAGASAPHPGFEIYGNGDETQVRPYAMPEAGYEPVPAALAARLAGLEGRLAELDRVSACRGGLTDAGWREVPLPKNAPTADPPPDSETIFEAPTLAGCAVYANASWRARPSVPYEPALALTAGARLRVEGLGPESSVIFDLDADGVVTRYTGGMGYESWNVATNRLTPAARRRLATLLPADSAAFPARSEWVPRPRPGRPNSFAAFGYGFTDLVLVDAAGVAHEFSARPRPDWVAELFAPAPAWVAELYALRAVPEGLCRVELPVSPYGP